MVYETKYQDIKRENQGECQPNFAVWCNSTYYKKMQWYWGAKNDDKARFGICWWELPWLTIY